jgi:hypothetical protein
MADNELNFIQMKIIDLLNKIIRHIISLKFILYAHNDFKNNIQWLNQSNLFK